MFITSPEKFAAWFNETYPGAYRSITVRDIRDEDDRARQLYEAGTPITDIASKVGRSYTAVLRRSWEKGWRRPFSGQRVDVTKLSSTNQNPTVSKRITSGTNSVEELRVLFSHLLLILPQALASNTSDTMGGRK